MTPTAEQYQGWLRSGDDAYERAVRTAAMLRTRLEEMEQIRARLVADRDALVRYATALLDARDAGEDVMGHAIDLRSVVRRVTR